MQSQDLRRGWGGLHASTSRLCLTHAHQNLPWGQHEASAGPLVIVGSEKLRGCKRH